MLLQGSKSRKAMQQRLRLRKLKLLRIFRKYLPIACNSAPA
jgi:hypothetical protein